MIFSAMVLSLDGDDLHPDREVQPEAPDRKPRPLGSEHFGSSYQGAGGPNGTEYSATGVV
jgi:hypothetical protein